MQLETLQAVALAVANERSIEAVLKRIVEGLAEQPGVALARVWLVGPGDLCGSCRLRPQCPEQTRCLHLAASTGRSQAPAGQNWSRLDGDFRRIPLGVRKVGRVYATGAALSLEDDAAQGWTYPEWVQKEGIRAFAGQPLIFRGEVLGVLAVFRRELTSEDELRWLRTFADHAAVAIANSRAFADIARLQKRLEDENVYLREEVQTSLAFGRIVGTSAAIQNVLPQIELVAATNATVLILGESGTGKELVAREIHERSQRSARPLIKVNCSAIPKDLFESEFFGHTHGSFTGALRDRPGRFQLADRGTIFLDEIGDLPLELQPKLLRILQEGEYERVGDDATRHVDVRVIAATNRDLAEEVRVGRFREDLYYRLSVFPIEMPPLRERKEDIPLLARHFTALSAQKLGIGSPRITAEECERLKAYEWPGNVRELQNLIERALILSRNGRLRLDQALENGIAQPRMQAAAHLEPSSESDVIHEKEWRRREHANLLAAMKRSQGRIHGPGGAAELLGLKASTLRSRLRALGITPSTSS